MGYNLGNPLINDAPLSVEIRHSVLQMIALNYINNIICSAYIGLITKLVQAGIRILGLTYLAPSKIP